MDIGTGLNVASGVLLAALGAWVLTIRPRRSVNLVFALFAISYGLRPIPANLAYKLGLAPALNFPLATLLALVSGASLAGVAFLFPRRVDARDRPALVAGGITALILGAAVTIAILRFGVTGSAQDTPIKLVQTLAFGSLDVVTGSILVTLSFRYRVAAPEEALFRRQVALVAAALLSVFAFTASGGWSEDASLLALMRPDGTIPPGAWMKLIEIGLCVIVLAFWLENTRHGPDTHVARNVALYGALVLLIGMSYAASGLQAGGHGVVRIASVLLLAVAIARFQLLDIDIRLRTSVKSGTIAAAFVALFFLASESAAAFFQARTGSTVVGLAAATLLVFALAPLQRVAERIANAAVPAPFEGARGARDAATAYRDQVRIAWRDGTITPKEMLMLRELRAYLRIPPEEAERIEAEVVASTG